MDTQTDKFKPANNRIAAPSVLRRYGSQLGIIGVGLTMWLVFMVAAPIVFLDIDIYVAFAQTSPQFGIIALALTFIATHFFWFLVLLLLDPFFSCFGFLFVRF